MARYYIAGLVPEDWGAYSIYFPNFPHKQGQGDTLHDAIEKAQDLLKGIIEDMVIKGEPLPHCMSPETAREAVIWARNQEDLPYPKNTFYQFVVAPNPEKTIVRVNISLTKGELDEIDFKAQEESITRSQFIVRASKKYSNKFFTTDFDEWLDTIFINSINDIPYIFELYRQVGLRQPGRTKMYELYIREDKLLVRILGLELTLGILSEHARIDFLSRMDQKYGGTAGGVELAFNYWRDSRQEEDPFTYINI